MRSLGGRRVLGQRGLARLGRLELLLRGGLADDGAQRGGAALRGRGHLLAQFDTLVIKLGGALLLMYTLGYTTPVLLTSILATSARDTAAKLEGSFAWVAPMSGSFLVAYGTYNVLVATLGPV